MKKVLVSAAVALTLGMSGAAFAQQYNPVPAGDKQYIECLGFSITKYQGGNEPSKIPGQSKAEAWCTCMWNETPENFSGDFVRFAESSQGAAMNATCEAYSGWR